MAKVFKPKNISDQVIVITGATTGIGAATAKLASLRGAKVVLAAGHGRDLELCANDIMKEGGTVLAVLTDVTSLQDIYNLRNKTIQKFGRIDTWVNSAGASVFGYLLEASLEEEKRLFDINFWGAKYGSLVAVEAMEGMGGVIINLGSEVAVSAQPLLGMYSASKNALRTFTESLRLELRDREYPIEVCLIRPTSIDAPLVGENYHHVDLGQEGPAAEAILKCAENPQRDVYVGGPARLSAILDTFFPQVKDLVTEVKMKEYKKSTLRESHKEDP